jgi:hypothetical protein
MVRNKLVKGMNLPESTTAQRTKLKIRDGGVNVLPLGVNA